mgnify:CR=1 FL=1
MFEITKQQYDYLLPIFGRSYTSDPKLVTSNNKFKSLEYFFLGTKEEYKDMLNRCKYLN